MLSAERIEITSSEAITTLDISKSEGGEAGTVAEYNPKLGCRRRFEQGVLF